MSAMRLPQYKSDSLIIDAILVPFILFATMLVFWFTENNFGYPSTEPQKTVALYAAIILSFLPLAAYILNFIAERTGFLAFKALGADITLDFSKKMAAIQQLDLPNEIFPPGMYQTVTIDSEPSSPKRMIRILSRNLPVATLNIKDGKAWWLSRLFALTAGAINNFGLPDVIVFVGTKENAEKTFIGWAETRAIFDSITRAYSNYEKIYTNSKAIYDQQFIFHPNFPTYRLPIVSKANVDTTAEHNHYLSLSTSEVVPSSFLDILLKGLEIVEETPGSSIPVIAGQPARKEAIWITKGLISDLFEHCWHTNAIDLTWTNEKQLETMLDMQGSYIPLVKQGQFIGMVKSHVATKVIVKQFWMSMRSKPGTK